jgi:hypothetical protein
MKKYLLTYWTERNDESTDVEIIISANNEEEAIFIFLEMKLSYKKIESIQEIL